MNKVFPIDTIATKIIGDTNVITQLRKLFLKAPFFSNIYVYTKMQEMVKTANKAAFQ